MKKRSAKAIRKVTAFLLSLLMILPAAAAAGAEELPQDCGIIDAEGLNRWMDEYVQEYQLRDGSREFSVGFCYTGTGDCWYYNADVFLYSASLYKVPVSMLMAEREAAGELTQQSDIWGTTLEYLESTALIHSNNETGHAMVSYLGGTYDGKCSDLTIGYTDLPEDYFIQDFYDYSYYTARYMTQVMKTLYDGGEARFPHVAEYLLKAQPYEYYNMLLREQYPVAQKYGAFTEGNGSDNNHCAAIIYTPTPIIVTVMTKNVGEYQRRIAEVGAFLAAYALTLDEHQEDYLRAREAAAAAVSAEGTAEVEAGMAEAGAGTAAEGTSGTETPAVDSAMGEAEPGALPGENATEAAGETGRQTPGEPGDGAEGGSTAEAAEMEAGTEQAIPELTEARRFPVIPMILVLTVAAAAAGLFLFLRRRAPQTEAKTVDRRPERTHGGGQAPEKRKNADGDSGYRPRH